MIRVAMIVRSSIFSTKGGDTVQVLQTAKGLLYHNIIADVLLASDKICYRQYHLLHFFNITRPSDILFHVKKSGLPFVVSTILIDYAEYDRNHRKGISGFIFRYLRPSTIEYFKVIARWLKGNERILRLNYLLKGQDRSIKHILKKVDLLLPNSKSEFNRLKSQYSFQKDYLIVPNGVDGNLFRFDKKAKKDSKLVICVARIEGIKNQINLIRALNDTKFNLIIIGNYAPNQKTYYDKCVAEAAENIQFVGELLQPALSMFYQKAKVHVLPSWFETTGLSSLESAFMGCNIVVTEKGDTKEYFGDHALYCVPGSPQSIYEAVEKASTMPFDENFRKKIAKEYTWQKASAQTAKGYHKIINKVWNLKSPFLEPGAFPTTTVDLNT
jgi:glycosyltransferase involved in cell wall biosynthesis